MKRRQPNNLVKQYVPNEKENRYEGITIWSMNGNFRNDFPLQLVNAVYNSPTGSACLEVWEEFVGGDGFNDSNLDLWKPNNDETLKQLHEKIASDFVTFWAFAVHIDYKADGEPSAFHHIPLEQTRLGLIRGNSVTDIRINPYFGIPEIFENKHTKVYYPYNPDPNAVIEEMKNHAELLQQGKVNYPYPGQIFWFSIERPLSRVYPVPAYYSVFNWMIVDAKIQQFHERNIDNNFLLSTIINMFGDPDAPANKEDENGDNYKTVREQFNEDLEESFSGSEVGGGVMVNWFKNLEQKADIQAFPSNTHDKTFVDLQEISTTNIARGFRVPRVLAGIEVEGKLGDTNEISNAVKVMQSRANKFQGILVEQYQKLFGKSINFEIQPKGWYIKNVNLINILPDWAIKELTIDEKRQFLNDNYPLDLGEIKEEEQAGSRFAEFGVGGVQGILSIQTGVSDGTIDINGAIETLKVVYGFSDEVAMKMLGKNNVTENDNTIQKTSNDIEENDVANDALRNLTGRQLQSIQRTVRKFNRDELTYDQAKTLLREFFKKDEDIDAWLVTAEEAKE